MIEAQRNEKLNKIEKFLTMGRAWGFARLLGGLHREARHTKNSESPKYPLKLITCSSNKQEKSLILPYNIFMREIVDLLEKGYFADGREWHSFIAVVYNSHSF